MNEEYKQIECISKMKKEYFDKFCTIVEGYREKISDNLVIGDSAFTLHDFDHHCFDIYKIILAANYENRNNQCVIYSTMMQLIKQIYQNHQFFQVYAVDF